MLLKKSREQNITSVCAALRIAGKNLFCICITTIFTHQLLNITLRVNEWRKLATTLIKILTQVFLIY